MTKHIVMYETRWYLAYQDGPASNETYDTKEEAKAELKKRRKHKGMGRDMCVMSRTTQVTS